jgi:hypothetical protein
MSRLVQRLRKIQQLVAPLGEGLDWWLTGGVRRHPAGDLLTARLAAAPPCASSGPAARPRR